VSVSLNPCLSFMPRFSIDRSTDEEQIFNIDPVTGAITLGKILDRETALFMIAELGNINGVTCFLQ